jgi:hypothetical protein
MNPLVGLAVFVTSMFGMRIFLESLDYISATKEKKPIQKIPESGPYRTAAAIPEAPAKPQPIKPKRVFKMSDVKVPEVKLSNGTKTFLYLLPVCLCAIAIGVLYDMSFPSLGIRTGMGFATGFIGIYFAVAMFVHIDNCSTPNNRRY